MTHDIVDGLTACPLSISVIELDKAEITLWKFNMVVENPHVECDNLLQIWIFHSHVSHYQRLTQSTYIMMTYRPRG